MKTLTLFFQVLISTLFIFSTSHAQPFPPNPCGLHAQNITPLGGANISITPNCKLTVGNMDYTGNQGYATDPDGDSLVNMKYDLIPWSQAPLGASLTTRVTGGGPAQMPLMDVTLRKELDGVQVTCLNTCTVRFSATILVWRNGNVVGTVSQTDARFTLKNAPEAITIAPYLEDQGLEKTIFQCINNCTIRVANHVYVGDRVEVQQPATGGSDWNKIYVTGRNLPSLVVSELSAPISTLRMGTYQFQEELQPFPNPFQDRIQFPFAEMPLSVRLISMTGQVFQTTHTWDGEVVFIEGITGCTSGVYVLEVVGEDHKYSAKIVKK